MSEFDRGGHAGYWCQYIGAIQSYEGQEHGGYSEYKDIGLAQNLFKRNVREEHLGGYGEEAD